MGANQQSGPFEVLSEDEDTNEDIEGYRFGRNRNMSCRRQAVQGTAHERTTCIFRKTYAEVMRMRYFDTAMGAQVSCLRNSGQMAWILTRLRVRTCGWISSRKARVIRSTHSRHSQLLGIIPQNLGRAPRNLGSMCPTRSNRFTQIRYEGWWQEQCGEQRLTEKPD